MDEQITLTTLSSSTSLRLGPYDVSASQAWSHHCATSAMPLVTPPAEWDVA